MMKVDNPQAFRFILQDELYLLPEDKVASPVAEPEVAVAVAVQVEQPAATPVIPQVLAEFRRLRMQDNHIYLRSASLNVVNGLVGLNFSCDGSHYLNYAEFLSEAGNLYV